MSTRVAEILEIIQKWIWLFLNINTNSGVQECKKCYYYLIKKKITQTSQVEHQMCGNNWQKKDII